MVLQMEGYIDGICIIVMYHQVKEKQVVLIQMLEMIFIQRGMWKLKVLLVPKEHGIIVILLSK